MSVISTTKKICFHIVSIALAIVVVFVLFVLQATSILRVSKQVKVVKIYTPPKLVEKNIVSTVEKRNISMLASSNINRNFDVLVPTAKGSNFLLPKASISSHKDGNKAFSVTLFEKASNDAFVSDIFELDMLDKIPKRLDKTIVEYPKQLLKRGIEGNVRLEVLIDISGVVSVERVVSSSNDRFSKSAVDSVNKFLYEAPTRNGKPVKARFMLDIPFKIR